MYLCPSYCTEQIHAHFPNASISVHDLEFSGQFRILNSPLNKRPALSCSESLTNTFVKLEMLEH
jgi:hypothetical protein